VIWVLALGNPLRGDDGVGARLAEALAEALAGEAIEVVESHEVMPEHAEALAAAEVGVVLDASVSGTAGDVRAARVAGHAPRPALLHALTPEELVGMAAAQGRAPPTILVTVAGKDFGFAEALSPEVEAAVPEALAQAMALVAAARQR